MATTTTPTWRERFSHAGWALLPLRLFIGFTMLYAGLLKLSDPRFFDSTSSAGIQAQMRVSMSDGPLSFIQSEVIEHSTLFGWAVILGEVAVGLSLLLGVWVRLGAVGGALISLSFLLTVSWGTTPYFFGPDIVFMFACIPLILAGDGGVWSIGSAIRQSQERRAAATRGRAASTPEDGAATDRRVLLRTGAVAAVAGVVALTVGALARMMGGSSSSTTSGGSSPSTSAAAGGRIASISDVPVGSAFAFNTPDGSPAYLVQPAAGTFLAFSRICTHEGCSVDFSSPTFVCPCHGATFSDTTGDPESGPARTPLQKYDVVQSGSDILLV